MENYVKNIREFMQRSDYEELTGVAINGEVRFKDLPYQARKGQPLPPMMADKVLTGASGSACDSTLYIHIPFCNLRCTYCDFYRHHYEAQLTADYVQALLAELDTLHDKGVFNSRNIKAVFFGGGTPSVLSPAEINSILNKLHNVAKLAEGCEITFESSLYDMDEEKLAACINGGVNRFSFGVQSFDSTMRKAIGRTYSCEEAMQRLRRIVELSGDKADIIIDLIYGLPGQSTDTLLTDIQRAVECGVSGMDLYKLQIMPKSPLGQAISNSKTDYQFTNKDLQQMFIVADEYLEKQGARQISCCHWGFKDRERSLYNTLVKNGTDIIACGCSCGGRLGAYQYMKLLDTKNYLEKAVQGSFPAMAFIKQNENYRFLEKLSGQCDAGQLNFKALAGFSSASWQELLSPVLEKWQKMNLLEACGDGYKFTPMGKYYYRQMTRVLLTAAEYALYGKPGLIEQAGQKMMGMMKNLK